MIASDDTRGRQNAPVGIGDRQDIGGLGFLASLIGHRLAPFLGERMAAVEVEVLGVDLVTDAQDTVLKYPLQAAIPTPLAVMMIDRMIADFFFCGSWASWSMGKRAH